MKKKERDAHFAAHVPGTLHYHQTMLLDGVRNKLLAEALGQYVTPETNFLDIGAGTGVWAILAAKLGAKRVVAIEIEECLIPIIFRHAQENGVADKIEIIHGHSDHVKIRGKFDLIVSELFGQDAMGEGTMKSFVSLRNRFLSPGGVLIPQKLAMFAAPAHIEKSVQYIPAELPIKSTFLQSLKLNYTTNLSLSDRNRVRFLAEPQCMTEVDFRTVETAPSLKNISLSWNVKDLSDANGLVVFNRSTFTDDKVMDSFASQSWGASSYEFKPFEADSGILKFDLTMDGDKTTWSVSAPSNPEIKPQTYSPIFAPTRLRMAQQMTPFRRVKPPKPPKPPKPAESDTKKQKG